MVMCLNHVVKRSDRRKSEGDIQGMVTLEWKWDEVVLRVEDISLVDVVFEGAFGGDGDDHFAMGKGRNELEWKPGMKKRKKLMEKNEEGGDYLIKRWW
ncbi:hypothetical protein Tco_1366205 [Tanacetum coccineum]